MALFDEREIRLIRNCIEYAHNDPAGLPGHNIMIIVSKLCWLFQNQLAALLEGVEWPEDKE